ncbi:MAG: tetratricopeptide repeat protein, partial [Deltaproteobacteria bacterium]|nr:tetratricopeptide repeat protein [Deltaproteobacteria bacterium]
EAARTLEPIYVSQQDWPNLVRIYEIKLEAAEDRDERLMLVRYIARLYEEQLEDLDGAFRWYGRVFREDPGDLGVRDQLMRLASVLESWRDLANVYQEYLDDETEDSEELLSVAASLAEIYDRRLSEIEPAHVCYRRVLSAQPDDGKVFAKLESMLRRAQRWYAVVELYEDTVEASLDDERRLKLLLQTALVLEQELEDPGRAVDTYRAVLDISPDHRTAIQELERLYEELERWQDLAELLQRQVDDAIDDQAANFFRLRLAEVLETHLDDVNVAIDHYQVALDYPGAQTALSALERLVLRDDLRERIAGVLEPLYRANDWWQKLVIILDARLEYVDDPSDRRRMLCEIAQIHEARGGDQSLALRALARAWQDDIRDEEVYDELAALVAKQGAWDQLIEAMEAGIADTYDYEQAAVVLGRVAEIHENQRGDIGAAIAAWTRLLEIKDDDGHALAELDRLYDQEERWAEQVKMIKRRADLAADAVVQVTLLRRAAERLERQLQDVDGAIVEYRNILGADDVNGDALDALERLYRQVQDWTELGQILVRKLEVEEHADERRRLRFDASEVFDQHLKDVYEAIAMMTAQLEEAATDGEALATLDRLYGREAMWSELLEVLDRRIELAEDAAAAAELGYRAAKVVEDKLVDPHGAIERYAAVIVLVPVHRGAREALDKLTRNDETLWSAADVLERLYRSENDFESVAELYERRLSSDSGDPDARPGYFQELARIHESSRADVDSAFRVWARALAENPERAELRGELERIVVTTGEWKHLAAEFENRLDDATDPELEFVYADELGRIYDQYLDDLGRSADRLRRALACADDEAAALAKLANVYSRSSQWPELAETLERQAQVAELEDEQAQYLFLLADVRETRLGLLPDAVEALREVVERDPAHVGARSALWRLLAHDTLRSEIIVILEPLFEDEQNFAQLADLLVHKLSVTDDAFERAALYSRLSELCEQNLSDPIRALDAAGGWLAEDPQSDEALANLGRLADVTGRYDEMAARLKGILDSGAADVMRPVLLGQLGSTYLDRLNEVDRAEKCFRDLATLEPDSTVALESLERIFRERGDSRMLAETLHRLAEQEGEPQKKKSLLAEVGGLRAQLGDLNGAAEIWREVLEVDEADDRAHQSLSEIYESKGQWHELIDILGIAANHASEPAIEQQLRARIAHVYADQLGELDAAAEAWTRVLDVEPSDLAALASLEAVQVQLQDWDAVRETLLRRLDVVDEGQQLDVLSRLVELALDKRDSPEEAVAHTLQVLEIDPHHQGAADKLEELYRAGEQWHELIELFEQRAELYDGDDRGVDYLARVADVWEGPLENPDAAAEVLEKILERDENYVPALTRLAKIYEANSDWDRCEEILQKALGLGPTGSQAADLHFRLAEVARAKDGDDEAARGHYHQALSDEPTHLPSIVAIGSIAREREDWPTLADMLTRQLEQVSEGDEMIELAVELARLQSKELGRAAEAVHVLEQVAQSAPDDPRVLGPLADAYFDAGRVEEAAPMYETLANEAKRGRRMKDLARYKQRIGGIYEAARDLEQALAAYEEAFRVDPTNAQTMAGLGRMYVDAQNWDKARRVYRSMVLQDLEENVGITKAEVFYNLGYIHVQLGELRKAKNMFQRGLELAPDDERLQAGLESVSD